jgi:Ca-activated chloride channel homolog
MRFTASVAGFGMLLRHSSYKGSLTYDDVMEWTTGAMTFDPFGHRTAFAELIRKAGNLE